MGNKFSHLFCVHFFLEQNFTFWRASMRPPLSVGSTEESTSRRMDGETSSSLVRDGRTNEFIYSYFYASPLRRNKDCNEICWGWGASQFQRLAPPSKKAFRKNSLTPPLGSGGAFLKLIFWCFLYISTAMRLTCFDGSIFGKVQRGMRPRQRTISKCQVQNIVPCAYTHTHTHSEHKKQEALIALQYTGCGEENKLRHTVYCSRQKNNPKCHLAVVGKRVEVGV